MVFSPFLFVDNQSNLPHVVLKINSVEVSNSCVSDC